MAEVEWRIARTNRFKKAFVKLTVRDREAVGKALRQLVADPRHPGLRVKKMEGAEGIWEARAGRSIRITFEIRGRAFLLRNVGAHDRALGSP